MSDTPEREDGLRKPMLREQARRMMAAINEDAWMDTNEVAFCCSCMIAACLSMADDAIIAHVLMEVDGWILQELREQR
jgi:hypothetical protein